MTNSSPSVSVIMPAYNSGKYIRRAIESILNQTHEDLELIIGDDCSTDSTPAIISEYVARDPRVKSFRNGENSGPAATSRRCIEISSAPVIAVMDSDDVSVPHRLERQLQLLKDKPGIAVVGSFASHINGDDEVLSLSRTGPQSIDEFHRLRRSGEPTMVFGSSAMFTRANYDAVGGFDASLRAAADIEFCDRMSEIGPVIAIPEPLLLYRIYGTSNVMMRFREGRRTHRYLAARRQARRNGDPLPTRDDYLALERSLPWWRRLNIWRDDFAQFHYRRAGLAFAERHLPRVVKNLAAAGLTRPVWVLRRIWDQRLSPKARRIRS